MSIIVTGILTLGFPLLLRKTQGYIAPEKVSFVIKVLLVSYLLVVLLLTLGLIAYDSESMVNYKLFQSYRKMFAPVISGFHTGGFKGAFERLKWVDYASRSSVVLNVFLFVPLGYLLPLSLNKLDKWYIVLVIGIGLSATIETAQLLTHRGWFDVDDIFHNGLGAFIGWLCYRKWLRNKTLSMG